MRLKLAQSLLFRPGSSLLDARDVYGYQTASLAPFPGLF